MENLSSIILDGKGEQGGASRRAGGRDERPPTSSGPVASSTSKRWIPPSSAKRDALSKENKHDIIFRKVRGILNKLTPEKFDKLNLELLNVGIDSQLVLKGIILLIFEKALDEPKYSSLYAQLCHRLCEDAPNFEPPHSSISTFRRLLLNKCQDEFENRSKVSDDLDRIDGPLSPEEMENYHLAKHKMLGNIKFIGELGKLEMLHEGILHKCIKQLLEKKKKVPLKDTAEDLECLCQIMRTVGRRLDTEKAKHLMDQYFKRIRSLMVNPELPSRIRFMLQDVDELRGNKWQVRKGLFDQGPKTIVQVREDAAKDLGVYYPPSSVQGPRGMDMFGMNGLGGMPQRGGIMDMFGSGGILGPTSTLGTGPGVIPLVDSFPIGYQGGRGKNQQNQDYRNKHQGGGSPKQQHRQGRGNQQQQQQTQQKQGNLPPRFAKKAQGQGQSPGSPSQGLENGNAEVSLRPTANFQMFKPQTPMNLPKSAQLPPAPIPDVPAPIMQKQAQITIKQVPALDKKQTKDKDKKPAMTKEELDKMTETMLSAFLASGNLDEAVKTVKAMKPPNKFIPEMVQYFVNETLVKTDGDQSNAAKLIAALKKEGIVSASQFMEAYNCIIDGMGEREAEIPLVRSYVAMFGGRAVIDDVITLLELAEPMENGQHYPLFLLCLQQIHKLTDEESLVTFFNDSKINLQNMLPESDRNKERMLEILEDRRLSFLFPLMRLQADLWKQIQADPNPNNFYKWIKENIDQKMYTQPGFVNALVNNILKYITGISTLVDGVDRSEAPEKSLVEKEKDLMNKYKGILQVFLHDQLQLQVSALYALQVHVHNNSFPKGMMLRMFTLFYDLEIIDEEAFLKWKEEVNDDHPGKGKALFQVNQWLTWLEQAEEESEEEETDEE